MELIIPSLLLLLVAVALIKGRGIYDAFVRGAREALSLPLTILPYMTAMLVALGIFRASGALDFCVAVLNPVMSFLGIPSELIALIVLRPFSGGAAIALLEDVFVSAGPDSYAGLMASVMLGSTETIFYTVALYFGSIGVKKTRHAVVVALISGVIGIIASVILSELLWK